MELQATLQEQIRIAHRAAKRLDVERVKVLEAHGATQLEYEHNEERTVADRVTEAAAAYALTLEAARIDLQLAQEAKLEDVKAANVKAIMSMLQAVDAAEERVWALQDQVAEANQRMVATRERVMLRKADCATQTADEDCIQCAELQAEIAAIQAELRTLSQWESDQVDVVRSAGETMLSAIKQEQDAAQRDMDRLAAEKASLTLELSTLELQQADWAAKVRRLKAQRGQVLAQKAANERMDRMCAMYELRLQGASREHEELSKVVGHMESKLRAAKPAPLVAAAAKPAAATDSSRTPTRLQPGKMPAARGHALRAVRDHPNASEEALSRKKQLSSPILLQLHGDPRKVALQVDSLHGQNMRR